MVAITVITDQGTDSRQVVSKSAYIEVDGERFEPAVVERVEYDHKGQSSSITTVCGETENRREGDNKPNVTMEGILGESQIQDAKDIKRGTSVTLISDIHSGDVYVERLTLEQTTDIVSIDMGGEEEEIAVGFQLQLKQPE